MCGTSIRRRFFESSVAWPSNGTNWHCRSTIRWAYKWKIKKARQEVTRIASYFLSTPIVVLTGIISTCNCIHPEKWMITFTFHYAILDLACFMNHFIVHICPQLDWIIQQNVIRRQEERVCKKIGWEKWSTWFPFVLPSDFVNLHWILGEI